MGHDRLERMMVRLGQAAAQIAVERAISPIPEGGYGSQQFGHAGVG